jgi:hypothetical protein
MMVVLLSAMISGISAFDVPVLRGPAVGAPRRRWLLLRRRRRRIHISQTLQLLTWDARGEMTMTLLTTTMMIMMMMLLLLLLLMMMMMMMTMMMMMMMLVSAGKGEQRTSRNTEL